MSDESIHESLFAGTRDEAIDLTARVYLLGLMTFIDHTSLMSVERLKGVARMEHARRALLALLSPELCRDFDLRLSALIHENVFKDQRN